MPTVLGIDVPADLFESWAAWLAPDLQPFFVGRHDWPDIDSEPGEITPEIVDTYRLWGVDGGSRVLWLSEERFLSLPRAVRGRLVREQVIRRRGATPTVLAWQDLLDPLVLRRQADGHRFVWWRSLIATDAVGILGRAISARRLPSRHTEVGEASWRDCEAVLPDARRLAGTFPSGSNTNCFGTVMAAAGNDDPDAYDSVEPFARWLASRCGPGGDTSRPGTVLVWRDRAGEPVHAAVSVGDGWALEKPSQEWHSPRGIATVADIVRVTRTGGQRLERHTIVAGARASD